MASPRKAGIPDWLYRVETDETRALLRASSEFARTGYAPFLQKAKSATGEDIAVRTAPQGDGDSFENNFFGCVLFRHLSPLLPSAPLRLPPLLTPPPKTFVLFLQRRARKLH